MPGAKIKVIWVGWAWSNTLNRMVTEGLDWVEFIAVNTDAQSLAWSQADKQINIGLGLTKGLWAWANPEVGKKSAEESYEEIKAMLEDTEMVFITAGMGWGTGTWAAPVIAEIAREIGILTVWVVTKPFSFEGKRRFQHALEGLERMKASVDTLIVIPNDKIFNIIDKKTTFKQAFSMIDKILYLWVQWISDLIVKPGDINIDFADINMIMKNSGTALLGIGYGEGEDRAIDAARRAIDNPLLEASLEGAKNIIFAVTWGDDLTPVEVQEAARIVEEIADPEAMIVWGMTFDESYEGEVKVSIIATGFPDTIQETMIRNVGTRQQSSRGDALSRLGTPTWRTAQPAARVWSSRTQSSGSFVNRAMDDEGVGSSATQEPMAAPAQEERDFETPAFLRRKLLNK